MYAVTMVVTYINWQKEVKYREVALIILHDGEALYCGSELGMSLMCQHNF